MIDYVDRQILIDWFAVHGRTFPWRETTDPYLVLVAVFMLQRTGVSQVMNVYPRFMSKYPTLQALRGAESQEVGHIIRPLGRLDRLTQLAALVHALVTEHGGAVPTDIEVLQSLPGLGQYSARSVMCMAHGQPFIMLDPNSYRVIKRAWGLESSKPRPHTDRDLILKLDREVPPNNPRAFNLALLDIGSKICRERKPRHDECPLAGRCLHYRESE